MSTPDIAAEQPSDLRLEIAHVLLVDLVGYSKLLVNEQIESLRKLNRTVRATTQFREAEARGKLTRIPTGDGMALIFSESAEAPANCALEIAAALRGDPGVRLRMGVHSGAVNRVDDVNDRTNVAGAGINVAQRVMDCGDAGHILLSAHVADDLGQYRHWSPFLHDLGECEVKHGLRLRIFNLYKQDLGNPSTPEKLRRRNRWRQHTSAGAEPHRVETGRFPHLAIALVILLSTAALATSLWVTFHHARPKGANLTTAANANVATIEKSVAVLPFENLSEDKNDSHFADAVQDEILTDLAKVAELKVISRTSVMQYGSGVPRNVRDVAKALGVTHVLEGSVQRAAQRVRITAQLIDARTDRHVWAERYDRELADVFAVQADVAQKIVSQLKVKLSPAEKAAIEEAPTRDLVAFDLYGRGKELIENAVFGTRDDNLVEAVRLLNLSIGRDRGFALAYYQLAHAHDQLYLVGADRSPNRLRLAEQAIAEVQRIRPGSGEAHLALAKHLYWGYRDYARAREELTSAERLLPNDPMPLLLEGYIDRRQSRWESATAKLEQALQLDPRNYFILQQNALTYKTLRRFEESALALDRALLIVPTNTVIRVQRATIELDWHADTKPLHDTIQGVLDGDPTDVPRVAQSWLYLATCERKPEVAERALAAITGADGCYEETIPFPRSWCVGQVARLRGDNTAARVAFGAAREELVEELRDRPEYLEAIGALGMVDAALGRKDEAIAEAKRAVAMLPVTVDSINGSLLATNLSVVYAWTGEKDLAIHQLANSVRLPGFLSYGDLRLDPNWDSLRGDPEFEKIVASLAPK